MATVNKQLNLERMMGRPTKGSMLAAGGDNIPTMMQDMSGNDIEPTSLKEGEIVFSVEAVVGAGNGDYDKGSDFLLHLHDELKAHGAEIIAQQNQSQGLNSVQ